MLIFADIETDGLRHKWEPEAATRIDCLVVDVDDEIFDYRAGEGKTSVLGIKEGATVVFHNGVDYDLPVLRDHWGWDFTIGPDTWCGKSVKHVDTMLLSKLVNPALEHPKGFKAKWRPSYKGESMPGPHSLEVWAARLGLKKPKLVYGDKMGNVPYAVSVAQATADIEITKALYWHLVEVIKARGVDLRRASAVEHKTRDIISEGAEYGVLYNQDLAEKSLVFLDKEMQRLADLVAPELPRRKIPASKVKSPPANPLNKDDTPSKNAIKYWGEDNIKRYKKGDIFEEDQLGNVKDGQWYVTYLDGSRVPLVKAKKPLTDTEPMTISDSADIKQWLIDVHGWRPTLWNVKKDEKGKKVKTSPKFHDKGKLCQNLEMLGEMVETIKHVVLYLSYRNRRSVIKSKDKDTGWLNHPRLKFDGRLPADADTMGTNTFRFKHRVVTNVPRVGSVFGEEMRGQFMADEGWKMVGWDASGLEDRVKAHYCFDMPGGKEYCDKILDPDFSVHDENVKAWGLPKPKCKNGHYAMQYNCRPPKLAETLGVPQSESDVYYKAWWANNLPLEHFIKKATQVWLAYDKKWLPAIDGRWVPCELEYMITSRLFQSAGVIAMKYAMVLWYNRVKQMKIPAIQVIHYHDEAQAVVKEGFEEEVGELGKWSIKRAGEILNFKVPLLSEYEIGMSWKDTH